MAFVNYKNEELYSFDRTPSATEDKKEYIKILKATNPKNNEFSVNIRTYYTKANKEIEPTPKGVFFNAENLLDVIKALVKILEADEIMDLQEYLEEELSFDEEDASSEE